MESNRKHVFEPTVEVGTTVYTCDSGGIKKWRVFEVDLVRSPHRDEYGNVVYPDGKMQWRAPSLREVYDLVSFDEKNDLTVGIRDIFLTPEEAAESYRNVLLNQYKNKNK